MAKNTPTASFSNCPNSLKPFLYLVHTSAAFLRLGYSCRPHQSNPKKGLFENTLQTVGIWKHRLSVPFSCGQEKRWTHSKYRSKMTGDCRVFKWNSSGVMWTENICCVFRVKPPFSNSSHVIWTGLNQLWQQIMASTPLGTSSRVRYS